MMNYDHIETLSAEDSNDDALLTIRGLKKPGIEHLVHYVKDRTEALDFINCVGKYSGRTGNQNIKLILLDIKMPKVAGMEVFEKVKSNPDVKWIPVVMLTSFNEASDIKKCYTLGAKSYIVKPFESDFFLKAIAGLELNWISRNQSQEL